MADLIERFCSVTGSDANVASHFLQMTNGDIDNAITFYFDSDQSDHSQITDNSLISQNMLPMEASRQPIPQKHERLIEPEISSGITVRTRSPLARNAFNVDPQTNFFMSSGSSVPNNQNGSGIYTLDKMFEPPSQILFSGTFEEAKQHAINNNKWLLVSVHNNEVFDCHRLNRDLWKNKQIIDLVKQSFVLWQVLKTRIEAQTFVHWYRYDKDRAHLAIIDPVTGECKMSFVGAEIGEPGEMLKTLGAFIKYNERGLCHDRIGGDQDLCAATSSTAAAAYNLVRKRLRTSDSEPECVIDITESIPRMKKMKILSPLSDADSPASCSNRKAATTSMNWLDYLGNEEDPVITILIRLPAGEREMISIPSSSTLQALFLFIRDRGCDLDKYELVKCFPKTVFSPKMGGLTLDSVGIVNRDTIHVQEICS